MLNIGEATDVQRLAVVLLAENETSLDEQQAAREAFVHLVERSHKVLGAGMTAAEADAGWCDTFGLGRDDRSIETVSVTVADGVL